MALGIWHFMVLMIWEVAREPKDEEGYVAGEDKRCVLDRRKAQSVGKNGKYGDDLS